MAVRGDHADDSRGGRVLAEVGASCRQACAPPEVEAWCKAGGAGGRRQCGGGRGGGGRGVERGNGGRGGGRTRPARRNARIALTGRSGIAGGDSGGNTTAGGSFGLDGPWLIEPTRRVVPRRGRAGARRAGHRNSDSRPTGGRDTRPGAARCRPAAHAAASAELASQAVGPAAGDVVPRRRGAAVRCARAACAGIRVRWARPRGRRARGCRRGGHSTEVCRASLAF